MVNWIAILVIATSLSLTLSKAQATEAPAGNCLQILETAKSLDSRAVGYSGEKTKVFLAYENAARQGSKIRTKLDWLLEHASPAGRLYSALLIRRLDAKAGRAALCKLTKDNSIVTEKSGCLSGDTTVSRRASRLLGNGPTSINHLYEVSVQSN